MEELPLYPLVATLLGIKEKTFGGNKNCNPED